MFEPLLDQHSKINTTKPEMEQVEREKQEYKLIGRYLHTRGLKLFAYNSLRNELIEVNTIKGDTVNVILNEKGEICAVDAESEKVTVDSRNIHFEALNLKNAQKRLHGYKQGRIKELCNLHEPGDGIDFYKKY